MDALPSNISQTNDDSDKAIPSNLPSPQVEPPTQHPTSQHGEHSEFSEGLRVPTVETTNSKVGDASGTGSNAEENVSTTKDVADAAGVAAEHIAPASVKEDGDQASLDVQTPSFNQDAIRSNVKDILPSDDNASAAATNTEGFFVNDGSAIQPNEPFSSSNPVETSQEAKDKFPSDQEEETGVLIVDQTDIEKEDGSGDASTLPEKELEEGKAGDLSNAEHPR
ncbi:unnamed protein product, partial [Mesorhabditis spiculigera]